MSFENKYSASKIFKKVDFRGHDSSETDFPFFLEWPNCVIWEVLNVLMNSEISSVLDDHDIDQ